MPDRHVERERERERERGGGGIVSPDKCSAAGEINEAKSCHCFFIVSYFIPDRLLSKEERGRERDVLGRLGLSS